MISMLLLAAVLGAAPLPDDSRIAPFGVACAIDETGMPQGQQSGRRDDKDTDKNKIDKNKKNKIDKDDKDTDRDDDTDTDTERNRRKGRVVCVDRDNNGMCDDRSRRADPCVDRDKDGFCDAPRNDDFCLDRDNDGRCDGGVVPRRFPQALPEMMKVAVIRERGRTADVNRWLGGVRLRVRFADADRNGVPERISFYRQGGDLLQLWIDKNGDGRADEVQVFQDGKRVKTIG